MSANNVRHATSQDANDRAPITAQKTRQDQTVAAIAVDHKTDSNREDMEDNTFDQDSGSENSWSSDEYPPLNLNAEALKHIAELYLPGGHGRCIDITSLSRGSFHEIRLLEFEDEWTCIARFTRSKEENCSVTESEIATRDYVRRQTTIPAPETYFVNLDPTNAVGAPFVLLEDMGGHSLSEMWPALKMGYRQAVMSQIADVVSQLAGLQFHRIGSLKAGGSIGCLQSLVYLAEEPGRGPFHSLEEYMLSFLVDDDGRSGEERALCLAIKEELMKFMRTQGNAAILAPPFSLTHGDFDSQNFLFIWESPQTPPRLCGVIDWDNSLTMPRYYLYEYPPFIRDSDLAPELYAGSKILRQHFVRELRGRFPSGSRDRQLVRECFRRKHHALNVFRSAFAVRRWEDSDLKLIAMRKYLEDLRSGEGLPYGGRPDYEPDSEPESDDDW